MTVTHPISVPRACAIAVFRTACRYDVLARKPGNVCVESPGHGMTARDFLASAAAAAPPATAIGNGLGASLQAAVAASVAAAGCNTNLGILLLGVPLLHAALHPAPSRDLWGRVRCVLDATTIADTEAVFAAIRCANPGGLGRADAQDVHATPTLRLRDVMQLAAARDLIARQYTDGCAALREVGVPALASAFAHRQSLSEAVTTCYFAFLERFPDSHIARKWGEPRAIAVQARGRAVASAWKACEDPGARAGILQKFDHELKHEGVNPGTSADLTVASLVAMWLETALGADPRGEAGAAGAPGNPSGGRQTTEKRT